MIRANTDMGGGGNGKDNKSWYRTDILGKFLSHASRINQFLPSFENTGEDFERHFSFFPNV